jgi:hypothetical protein
MLNKTERLLAEAIDTMLRHNPKLGLSFHDGTEETSHFTQFKHEQINEMFELETTDLVHHDGTCSAFNKVHSYKYVDDPKFIEAFKKELSWQAVPDDERAIAEAAVGKVLTKLAKEAGIKEFDLQSVGWNPKLDEIQEISQPEQPGI